MSDSRIYYVNEQDCKVWVQPDYFSSEEAEALHQEIVGLPLIQHCLGMMYGKETYQPRLSIALGREYSYSGKKHPSIEWSRAPLAHGIMERINRDFESDLTDGLVNYYRTGNDSISAHSDDESTLAKNGGVYGISTGHQRDMIMRWRLPSSRQLDKDRPRLVIPLPVGSLFAMEGEVQKRMTHEMPIRKRAGDRGSVTYRRFQ